MAGWRKKCQACSYTLRILVHNHNLVEGDGPLTGNKSPSNSVISRRLMHPVKVMHHTHRNIISCTGFGGLCPPSGPPSVHLANKFQNSGIGCTSKVNLNTAWHCPGSRHSSVLCSAWCISINISKECAGLWDAKVTTVFTQLQSIGRSIYLSCLIYCLCICIYAVHNVCMCTYQYVYEI